MAERKVEKDPREADLFETMILDSMEYIHGEGFDPIVKELRNSTDTTATMAAIAYKCVRGVAENNKATARVDMDMDMMMGVTTECIDMVTEVAEAGGQLKQGTNVDQMKEDVLLRVSVLHGEQLGDKDGKFPKDMKQSASADLRDYMSDDGVDKAFSYVEQRAKAEGLNTEDMKRAGNEMAFGSKNPLAEGVNRGLMAETVPHKAPDSAQYEAAAASDDPNLTMPDGSPIPTEQEIQAQMDASKGVQGAIPAQNVPPGFRDYTQEEMQNLDQGGQVTPAQIDARAQGQAPLMPAPPKPNGGY